MLAFPFLFLVNPSIFNVLRISDAVINLLYDWTIEQQKVGAVVEEAK